jgi:hypothetical protein
MFPKLECIQRGKISDSDRDHPKMNTGTEHPEIRIPEMH